MLHITAQHRLPQVGNPDTLQWALINQLILEEKIPVVHRLMFTQNDIEQFCIDLLLYTYVFV